MSVCLFVCLSVRYTFGDRMSKCNQTFQKLSSHPGEGRHLLFFLKKINPLATGKPMETDQ